MVSSSRYKVAVVWQVDSSESSHLSNAPLVLFLLRHDWKPSLRGLLICLATWLLAPRLCSRVHVVSPDPAPVVPPGLAEPAAAPLLQLFLPLLPSSPGSEVVEGPLVGFGLERARGKLGQGPAVEILCRGGPPPELPVGADDLLGYHPSLPLSGYRAGSRGPNHSRARRRLKVLSNQ